MVENVKCQIIITNKEFMHLIVQAQKAISLLEQMFLFACVLIFKVSYET